MAAFRQAFNNLPTSSSAPNLSIRGSADGAPASRGFASALRNAGMSGRNSREASDGMELDGPGRPTRNNNSRQRPTGPARDVGPNAQGQHRGKRSTPYGKPPPDRPSHHMRRNSDAGPSTANLAGRIGGPSGASGSGSGNRSSPARPRRGGRDVRAPVGTPDLLHIQNAVEEREKRSEQRGKVTAVFSSPEFHKWLRDRNLAPGLMDMSNLPTDAYLKSAGVEALGSRDAASNLGAVLWSLIRKVVEDATRSPITTMTLANNELKVLQQLSALARCLPQIRALDLSNNPISSVSQLDSLLAGSEKRGKAVAGVGSLKGLIELKLTGCKFRDDMFAKEGGAEKYQHEILRRFPGLLILDGVNLQRIVFPLSRQPKMELPHETKQALAARPFAFPADVKPGFMDNAAIEGVVMQFCAKFFPLYDTNRTGLALAYAPTSTLSVSCNPTTSRSAISQTVSETRHSRPRSTPFTQYVEMPSRNFLRHASSIESRVETLQSPADPAALAAWWAKMPATTHPLEDGSKWLFDAWVLDEFEGGATACVTIQGEFAEQGTLSQKSFSRTFIIVTVQEGTAAQQAGWPCQILSDTLVVHPYLSNAAYPPNTSSSIAQHGVAIIPPDLSAVPAPAPAPATAAAAPPQGPGAGDDREALVQRMRAATGMNQQFSTLCLEQNGWNFEVAVANFQEIKGTIPPEAYQ